MSLGRLSTGCGQQWKPCRGWRGSTPIRPKASTSSPARSWCPTAGEMNDSGAGGYSLHTLVVEISRPRGAGASGRRGEGLARPFCCAARGPHAGGIGVACALARHLSGGALNYNNNITHYGMRFRVTVK